MSRRRGIALMMGGDDALFAPALVLLPLIALQPFDSVAAVAAVTTTTIKTKAAAGAAAEEAAAAAAAEAEARRRRRH